ncbi:hypothetical protein FOC1_g10009633 [Fusarium oxysporum f. sp. cubense race 1]|uniref:Uncharacterized protein n=1 Tax=Fusarium oxysporum f. sp. cubense (strain race 1) TaxID=1229664 RepID=N4URY3_FUSC1|nr:hypothetical protein FOC1_g10009633 [Fusarium oxysporum f. sp. cubense race 1]
MDASLPEEIIQPTKEDTSITCSHLKPGFGASRARNHNHASRHGNTTKMLQRKVACGSEDIDVALYGPSFNLMSQEQAMQSCPELGCRDDHSWVIFTVA